MIYGKYKVVQNGLLMLIEERLDEVCEETW